MNKIVVTDSKHLDRILDYVHDRSFGLSDIGHSEESRSLTIPLTVVLRDKPQSHGKFLFINKITYPIVESKLVIHNVCEYSLEDNAQIDKGDVNTIEVNKDSVTIQCSLPVVITLKVSEFRLELLISDIVVDQWHWFRSFFERIK